MNKVISDFNFAITECDISEIIPETTRFVLHILLVHIITYTIDGKDIFGINIFKSLFVTAIAIMIYHILFKKVVVKKLNNLDNHCKHCKK